MLARRLPSPRPFLGLGCAPGRAPVAPWRMATLVNVDGRLVPPEQAFVPVLDRGFLYGDSVYEVVRTYGGRVFELGRHLDRMERPAARIGLLLPPRSRIKSDLFGTLGAAGNAVSYQPILPT